MTVYGYIRVSTLAQIDLSPIQQRHEVTEWCRRNDLSEPTFFADEGVSGMKADQRLGYQALLKACKTGDVVVTYDLSRLGRRAKEVLSALDLFREHGIRYVSIRQGLDSSSIAASLVYGVLAVVNEMLVLEARQRTKAALDYKKSKGERLGGVLPVGYDLAEDGVKLVPNAAEFETLLLIQRLRHEGWSFLAIARELQKRGIRSKTGLETWHPNTVRRLYQRTTKSE